PQLQTIGASHREDIDRAPRAPKPKPPRGRLFDSRMQNARPLQHSLSCSYTCTSAEAESMGKRALSNEYLRCGSCSNGATLRQERLYSETPLVSVSFFPAGNFQ